MSPIFALDFEASCLPEHGRSFPIEVGVAGPEGEVRSWLIRPEPAWRDWTWTEEAERLHGLTYDELVREGLPACQVLHELVGTVGGSAVFADSYHDAGWMRTLEAADHAPPLIDVQHVNLLIDEMKVSNELLARVLKELDESPFRRHRAGEDARWLQALITRLLAHASLSEAA